MLLSRHHLHKKSDKHNIVQLLFHHPKQFHLLEFPSQYHYDNIMEIILDE